jgi:hypothetical protein
MLQKSPVDTLADARRKVQEKQKPRLSEGEMDILAALWWASAAGLAEGVLAALYVTRIELFWSLAWMAGWALLGCGAYLYYVCRRA